MFRSTPYIKSRFSFTKRFFRVTCGVKLCINLFFWNFMVKDSSVTKKCFKIQRFASLEQSLIDLFFNIYFKDDIYSTYPIQRKITKLFR
jgi:hypothetical protein